jgi:hypothetical protein
MIYLGESKEITVKCPCQKTWATLLTKTNLNAPQFDICNFNSIRAKGFTATLDD